MLSGILSTYSEQMQSKSKYPNQKRYKSNSLNQADPLIQQTGRAGGVTPTRNSTTAPIVMIPASKVQC